MLLNIKKWEIDKNNVLFSLSLLKERIALMNKLYETDLDEDEIFSIILFCYSHTKNFSRDFRNEVANDLDIAPFSEPEAFDVEICVYPTMSSYTGSACRQICQKFYGYARSSVERKETYSIEELEDLIKKHDIVITNSSIVTLNDEAYLPEVKKRIDALFIQKHTFLDLGIYKEWYLYLARKYFTKERVNKDILDVIAIAKQSIKSYQEEVQAEITKYQEYIDTRKKNLQAALTLEEDLTESQKR